MFICSFTWTVQDGHFGENCFGKFNTNWRLCKVFFTAHHQVPPTVHQLILDLAVRADHTRLCACSIAYPSSQSLNHHAATKSWFQGLALLEGFTLHLFKHVSQNATCLLLSEFNSTKKSESMQTWQSYFLVCSLQNVNNFFLNFLFVLTIHALKISLSEGNEHFLEINAVLETHPGTGCSTGYRIWTMLTVFSRLVLQATIVASISWLTCGLPDLDSAKDKVCWQHFLISLNSSDQDSCSENMNRITFLSTFKQPIEICWEMTKQLSALHSYLKSLNWADFGVAAHLIMLWGVREVKKVKGDWYTNERKGERIIVYC